jgi:hypothetical protein
LAPAIYPLALARAAYPADMFAKALALLHKETPDSIHWLLWPAPGAQGESLIGKLASTAP